MSHFLATFEFVVPGAKSRASGQRLDRERGISRAMSYRALFFNLFSFQRSFVSFKGVNDRTFFIEF